MAMSAQLEAAPFDDVLVCPVSGRPLYRDGDALVGGARRRYAIKDGILRLFVEPGEEAAAGDVTGKVKSFYEATPFPNYNDFDNLEVFVRRAKEGVFAQLLSQQIPIGANVLEVGCGTGQLSNYLAATTMAKVYAADMTGNSLALGARFARENGIDGITFVQMNLFRPCFREESMDLVISNGVLHHTADPKGAFLGIAKLVKPGGHIIIGLYNKIGRLPTDVRRALKSVFGEGILMLDSHLRNKLSPDKRRAWVADQYEHPHESKHTFSEVLDWFEEAGYEFVSSIPPIRGAFGTDQRLFEKRDPGTPLERRMTEIEMLLAGGREGGLFIVIGRRS